MKILLPYLLFSFLFLVRLTNAEDGTKLVFVQILWRHGDRAPITLYPTDPNPESFWTEGLGKLTLLGRKQHYALGKFFRNMYENLTTSSPLEVNVISSDCDRCLKSAETNLASFFAPTDKWAFDEHFRWQPISISYIPKKTDKYLETDSDCPQATEEAKRVFNSPEGQKFIGEHKAMLENLTYYSGKEIANWTQASYFHDTVSIENKYNLTTPKWVLPYWEELQEVSDLSFFWSYNSPLLHRLRAGPLLQRIIETMSNKMKGDTPNLKFQIYSAHDTNIAVVLDALFLYNMRQPPYCSALIFELHESALTGEKLLRLLYQNSSRPEVEVEPPHALVLEGCSEFCPLDRFRELTKHLMPDDWERECQLKKSLVEQIKDKKVTIGWFFVLIAGIIACASVYALWRICSRKKDKDTIYILKGVHLDPN